MIPRQKRGRAEAYNRIQIQSASCEDGGSFAKGQRTTACFFNERLFWASEETEDPEGEEQLMGKAKQQWCKINKQK